MRRLLLILAAVVCALSAHAQTAINDTLYLQSATPWTGQITITWPAFTTATGTPVAAGRRVYAVNSGVVSITLFPTVGASPTVAYAASYRTAVGEDRGKAWDETWVVPASPSIVTLADVRKTSSIFAGGGSISSVAGRTGDIVLAQSDITGLVSALAAKADASALTAHTSNTSNPHSVTKAQVGLGNVDNTADVDKPVSAAMQAALDAIGSSSFPGVTADGSNGLDVTGAVSVTSGQPTEIDVVATTVSALPTSGVSNERHMLVSDGLNAADCGTGGGGNRHWCYWDGSQWQPEATVGPTGPAGVASASAPLALNGTTHDVSCATCEVNTNKSTSTSLGTSDTAYPSQNAVKTYVDAAVSGKTVTIASGSTAMGTSAIASATCATVVTVSASGVATTDVVSASFNGDPTAVTGYIPATSGTLAIYPYPTANNVNFKVCNSTAGSITPGAITINWRVSR